MKKNIKESSAGFAERLFKKNHEGLGFLRLVKNLKEVEEEDKECSSFMALIASSDSSDSRSSQSEKKRTNSEDSFLELVLKNT